MATVPVDAAVQLVDLTSGSVDGNGVFDKLMMSVKAHLTQEYRDQRIKGPEFATVYLGALDNVLNTSVQFLLQKARVGLEAQLLEQQIILAGLEVEKARIALEIVAQEKLRIIAEVAKTEAETLLIKQNVINSEVEKRVLEGQVCKLKAEFDNLMSRLQQTTAEIALIGQKTVTEKAQVQSLGVDPDSVIGKQKALYQAQTEGFARDSELKATKMLVDTWSTRRMTDDGVVVDNVNKLDDSTIGRAVTKVLVGIGA